MEACISKIFSVEEMIPAAGQGILAFQGRKGEEYSYLTCACNKESEYAAMAERSFVTYLDGGCSSPIAAYASITGQELKLRGLYYHEPAEAYSVGEKIGTISNAEKLAEELAEELVSQWK